MNRYCLLLFLVFGQLAFAQENTQYIHKHLTRATLTFSTGYLFKTQASPIYLKGDLEYYTDATISIRGDSYLFVNTLDKNLEPFQYRLARNDAFFFGPVYHFKTNNHLDPFIGAQPGMALVQTKNDFNRYRLTANPLVSGLVGFNYYASKVVHLYINARYCAGRYLSDAPTPLSLQEIRFEFGLGFNAF